MNVCSLLNNPLAEMGRRDSTPSATGETTAPSSALPTPPSEKSPSRRSSGAGSPGRTRTPWDGNGYSLPLTIETKALIPSPGTAGSTCPRDSPARASAGHKYSDSQSSLSSFASSTTAHSGSHSRISSLSTVGELQPFDPSADDIASVNNGLKTLKSTTAMADIVDSVDPAPNRRDGDLHPRGQAQRLKYENSIDLTGDERPESPTDALMVRRPQAGSSSSASPLCAEIKGSVNANASGPGDDLHKPSASQANLKALDSSDGATSGDANPGRSAAAPAAAQSQVASDPILPAPGQGDPAPVISAEPHQYLAAPGVNYSLLLDSRMVRSAIPRLAPDVPALMKLLDFHLPKSCSFMENCDLMNGDDTKWRKAMSHIFGRNKGCTRRIPTNVWVLLCRKHYQRGRYRSTVEYGKRLIRLIERQILRLEVWSNENQHEGKPEDGIVRDWTIVVRRREQMRLEKEKERRNKRKRDQAGSGQDSDDEMDDMMLSSDSPHVPQWLLDMCNGTRYSTLQIQAVVSRISDELDSEVLKGVPDIEFLPDIEGDNTKPKSSRAKAAKPPGHTQAQPSQDLQSARRASQPNLYRPDDATLPAVAKRQRVGGQDAAYNSGAFGHRFAPRAVGHTVPQFAAGPHANVHGPVSGRHALDDRAAWAGYGHSSTAGPLPDPRTGYYLDDPRGGFHEYRGRAPHQRAFSDGNALQSWAASTAAQQPEPAAGYYGGHSNVSYNPYYPPPPNTTGYYPRPAEGYPADVTGIFGHHGNPHPEYAVRPPHHQPQAVGPAYPPPPHHHMPQAPGGQGQGGFYPHHSPSTATAAGSGSPRPPAPIPSSVSGLPSVIGAARHVRTQSTPVLMHPRPVSGSASAAAASAMPYHQDGYGSAGAAGGSGGSGATTGASPRHTTEGWSG